MKIIIQMTSEIKLNNYIGSDSDSDMENINENSQLSILPHSDDLETNSENINENTQINISPRNDGLETNVENTQSNQINSTKCKKSIFVFLYVLFIVLFMFFIIKYGMFIYTMDQKNNDNSQQYQFELQIKNITIINTEITSEIDELVDFSINNCNKLPGIIDDNIKCNQVVGIIMVQNMMNNTAKIQELQTKIDNLDDYKYIIIFESFLIIILILTQ